ncbi:MAG: family 43 glycosylhydrolase [Sphingobacteriia bacterium]|nr:family 43 glycosylhydrolase [Sphingobacteriia bacterium]
MKTKLLLLLLLTELIVHHSHAQDNALLWNGNRKCAVVLTYDDALNVHLNNAIPVLDTFHLKATFYLSAFMPGCKNRLNDWKIAAAKGHELGNHTLYHPCLSNIPGREWVKGEQDMSKYSLQRLENEIRMTNVFLEALDGKKQRTFAYTCGDMKVADSFFMNGMKNDFIAARAVRSEMHHITDVNLYNIDCYAINGETGEQLIELVKKAEQTNSLLVLLFHGVGGEHSLNVSLKAHRELLQYLHEKEKDIWVAPMAEVATYIKNRQKAFSYINPILAGFYPDPSICSTGNDYYLINSTFVYYPGIPIFQSKNLINWQQIGNAINRPSQVNFEGATTSRGLYAPSISYHKGVFYIVCTLIDKGGNFIITAKDPAGPWSDPYWLKEIDGIDPSLFFDDDKAYIVYNSIPPENKSLWDGHRTIRIRSFDVEHLKVINDERIIINGGVDTARHPVWIEGPHIFKKEGYYYLICAEGGTAYNHSEVVFRTKDLTTPFIPFEQNPILTQRHLNPERKDPITTTGHADFVQAINGNWYAVFLGCRPYEGDHYNTGRETFMLPVQWENDWPVILKNNNEVPYHVPSQLINTNRNIFSGNYFFKDEFNSPHLDKRYMFLRVPHKKWYNLTEQKGKLSLQTLPQTCSQLTNPAFIGFRQAHTSFEASTSLAFKAKKDYEKAGLLIFQNEHHFYYLCQSIKNKRTVLQLYQSTVTDSLTLLSEQEISVSNTLQLKVKSTKKGYSFYYAVEKNKWVLVSANMDNKFLSTKTAGGFIGTMIAMYATANGHASNNKAFYDNFYYQGDDEVFR